MDELHPLLLAVQRAVELDREFPGLVGTAAIGVTTSGGTQWWVVELGRTARGRLGCAPTGRETAILLLSEEQAEQILATGKLGAAKGRPKVQGDRDFLLRLVERYFDRFVDGSMPSGNHGTRP